MFGIDHVCKCYDLSNLGVHNMVYVGTNVFKGEIITQGIFVYVRQSVNLEALRHKPFVMTNII